MCGIIGEINSDGVDIKTFTQMRDELAHRGPDGAGLYTSEDGTVVLGHRRLSIIDLCARADQPMSNEDGTVWLTYNGEIYNYQSLREELIECGHEFTSETDSEVIVHGYEEWGTDCVERFRGMFAFGLWDEQAERLMLARDRLGIKPLYYYPTDTRFVFASELKGIVADTSIPRTVDPTALRHFLMYRYVPSPYAIWEGAKKLSPGHILIHEDGESTVEQYWDVEQFVATETPEEATAVEQLEEIVTEAVGLNLVSDVPLGVLLSGGVDSSLVAAMSTAADADPTAFSMGFDSDRFDELEHAHLVAEDNDLEHVEEMISSDDLSELLDDLLYYYDEPLGDSSIFPTYLLMDRTSDKLKTVVSGDGGDEVFAGYNWYDRYETYQRLDSIDWLLAGGYSALDAIPGGETSRYVRGVKHRLEPYTKDGFDRYRTVMARRFEDSEVESLLGDQYDGVTFDRDVVAENWTDDPETKDLQTLDMRSLMSEDILVKVDRASMAHSLEVRVPLLDHQIVEYAMSLDDDLLFRDGNPKHMLKRVAAKYLPDRIIDRPKRGFSAPLDELGFIEDNLHVLADSRAAQDGVFDGERLQTLAASDPGSLTATDSAKLWLLILFELWYRKWRLPESTEQGVAVSHKD